ncbi:hypothetical protein WJX74_002638 [Apatococcus lobatus]|uniref:Magnesium transporter n=2 Tax=Apatococcus TaxID=904362 RepID=A0AAW1SZR7_9CHLO
MSREEDPFTDVPYSHLPDSTATTPRSVVDTTTSGQEWHQSGNDQYSDRGQNSPPQPQSPFLAQSQLAAQLGRGTQNRTPPGPTKKPYPSKPQGTRATLARRFAWLCISSNGQRTTHSADKRTIIQHYKLGIPIRDMRLLDPNLLTSETGKILVRDNAIVFSMEHVRLIITADEVIIPMEGFEHNHALQRFNQHLESAIRENHRERASLRRKLAEEAEYDDNHSDDTAYSHNVPQLPFELQVLELALGDICQMCSNLGKELDGVAFPALDELMKHVSTHNLERVRKVKTRHQRLQMRVTTVREDIESFLQDDDDMMKLCLTRKKELEQLQQQQLQQQQLRTDGSTPIGVPMGSISRRSSSMPHGAHRHWAPSSPRIDLQPADSMASDQGYPQQSEDEESIEAIENLLESYFMQIDSCYDRLVSMGEYIKDTEEYINIELDSSRNRLIKLEIVITAATFSIALWGLVAGVLGENLKLPESITKHVGGFFVINGATLLICILFFYAILAYIRYKRLM